MDRKDGEDLLSLPIDVAAVVLAAWPHRADCRIFLDKNVKDIIKEVFTDAGFPTTSNSAPPATTTKSHIAFSIAKPIWPSSAG